MRRQSKNIQVDVESERKDWNLGTNANSISYDIETWSYVQHKDYALHFLYKPEKFPKYRPRIKTTESQRLAYLRGISTSPFRNQIIYIQLMNFNAFFWLFIEKIIFKSIPMNYVHVFLAAYSPDEHMYASKMCPLLTGISWQVAICGLFQLVSSADLVGLYMQYGVSGFRWQSPWNRCLHTKLLPAANYMYRCLTVNEFLNISSTYSFGKVVNGYRMSFYANHYVIHSAADNDSIVSRFTGAPMVYFMREYSKLNVLQFGLTKLSFYVFLAWLGAALCYKQLYKQYIWKLMSRLQLVMNAIYLLSTLYVMWTFMEEDPETHHHHHAKIMPAALDVALDWDLDMLADCNTAPPIIQLLYSRSTDKVQPGRDSTLITISNSILYLFKSITNYKLKSYVESRANMPILFSWFNEYPIFYFWPFFFDQVILGDIALRLFYLLNAFMEFMLFMITYQLLIEVLVCEWKIGHRMISTMVLTLLGVTLNMVLNIEAKKILFIYNVLIASVCEAVVIFWLYPLARLKDDIHFHTGTRPTFLRVLSLGIVPFYYMYKLLRFFNGMSHVDRMKKMLSDSIGMDLSMRRWAWIVPIVPLVVGAMYAVVKYVIRSKQKCNVLLKPRPDWGPRDHVTRQLRKQFDTRDYISSQASRYLSRHLMAKAQTAVYKLDTRYDFGGRRSTIFAGFNPGDKPLNS